MNKYFLKICHGTQQILDKLKLQTVPLFATNVEQYLILNVSLIYKHQLYQTILSNNPSK